MNMLWEESLMRYSWFSRMERKLLIDLNGKEVNKDYEDYLYDIYRCKIAQNSGFQYYRLWLSNYYNQQLKELNNIKADFGQKKYDKNSKLRKKSN